MNEPYWWYVLYVKSNTEHKVAESFQKAYNQKGLNYQLEAFCLESERYYSDKSNRKIGKTYQKRPLFPGYVFVETNMPSSEFCACVYDIIYNTSNIIKLLRYEGTNEIAISHEERVCLEYLMQGKRCVEHSVGCIEGDKIIVNVGPLKNLSGHIIKINRHHRSAQIEVELFGRKQIVELALEILTKC